MRAFNTRLRGVNVKCVVKFDGSDLPQIQVETRSESVERGLREVSKFAGYCRRTLVLSSQNAEEVKWATVLASYFGFGLDLDVGEHKHEIMPAPALNRTDDEGPQNNFTRRVLSLLPQV